MRYGFIRYQWKWSLYQVWTLKDSNKFLIPPCVCIKSWHIHHVTSWGNWFYCHDQEGSNVSFKYHPKFPRSRLQEHTWIQLKTQNRSKYIVDTWSDVLQLRSQHCVLLLELNELCIRGWSWVLFGSIFPSQRCTRKRIIDKYMQAVTRDLCGK